MALPMEFWGVEVKAGQPLKVHPGEAKIIHLSQACLGESKGKGNDSVPLFVKFGDQKLVLGTLSSEHFPQINFDLVFEKEFELSHNWKHGTVFFAGYRTILQEGDELSDDESDESEEDIPLTTAAGNGKAEAKRSTSIADAAKPESTAKKVTIAEPVKMEEDSDDEDDDDDEEDDSDDDSDEEEETDDEDEETPKKAEVGKKRPADSAASAPKTPVTDKKAKASTPQKTDGKKGSGHTATPHPNKKQGSKVAAAAKDGEKSKQPQTPKTDGNVTCGSCSKTFKSETALQSHSKAKHSAAK